MIVYLLWALCCIGLGILLALISLMFQSQRLAKVLEIQLNGLADTHMLGFEALTLSIARVEARVKAVEEEVL